MALSTIPFSLPAILSVYASMAVLISSKLKYFFYLSSSGNTPYGFEVAYLNQNVRFGTCTILNSSGLLVTTPEPLGKKSRPTMFSKSDDLPDDWVPKDIKKKRTQYSNSGQLNMFVKSYVSETID
jgi:hypothetical protein